MPPLPHQAWRDALARARRGELAFLDHPWPGGGRILKLLCADEPRLLAWAAAHGIPPEALDHRGGIPHLDFRGPRRDVLLAEGWPVARIHELERGAVLIAEDPEGLTVGFAAYERHHDGDPRLLALYVLPAARGRGVGALLLRRAPQGRLWAQVASEDGAAARFLGKHGFRPAGGQVMVRETAD